MAGAPLARDCPLVRGRPLLTDLDPAVEDLFAGFGAP